MRSAPKRRHSCGVTTAREIAEELDRRDPISHLRERFVIDDPTLIYLDGNSLGRLSTDAKKTLHAVIDEQWGSGLIRGWTEWMTLPTRVGDLIGETLLGAASGQVVVADSTTVNLYKLASAAIDARPGRRTIVTDDDNFPTDRYVLQGIAQRMGLTLKVIASDIETGVDANTLQTTLDGDVALVSLSHVAYRSGALADMAGITSAVHDAGALVLWDLSHSAGSVAIELDACDVDFATGCSYKYLNGGPGAPAYSYVNQRLLGQVRQPIWGWFGQRDQFAMGPDYDPVDTIDQQLVGTSQVLQTAGLEASVALLGEAGVDRLQAKGQQLTDLLIELTDEWLTPHRARVASPRKAAKRGSHVVIEHPSAWQIAQALLARNVIPDYRNPNRVRLGPAPIYTRFVDVWDGVDVLRQILESGEWESFDPQPKRVT